MKKQILLINKVPLARSSSPKEILDTIAALREQKGKEEQILKIIDQSILFGHDFVVDLFWEEAILYQHKYMIEIAKPKVKQNKRVMEKALGNMGKVIKKAEFYVKKYELKHWESRLYRFLGRIHDYSGNYEEAVKAYKKAIPLARKDPDYIEKGYPRWLELEGFLSYSLIMSGELDKGYELAGKVCKKFNEGEDGKNLRRKDYTTWAIWKSGVMIRTITALKEKKDKLLLKKCINWLDESKKDLNPPKNIKTWADFKFRREEMESLKKDLYKN